MRSLPNADWTLVKQLVRASGVLIESYVKTLRFRPVDGADGKTHFVALKWQVRQILVNIAGCADRPVKVTLCNGNYKVKWPDSEKRKTFTTGQGKTKRQALDWLNPEIVKVKGQEESFPSLGTLVEYCDRRFGGQVAAKIEQLL
jgi:hypothetical protein